jgi:MFS transporter, DHA2 family, metal-tetracycline-proton antiporter
MASPVPQPPSAETASTDGQGAGSGAVLLLLAGVVFLAVVNGTMVNVALPYLGEDFGVSEGVYGWVVTGYALSFGIFNAVDGRLADIVGIRRLYLSGIAVLGLTSIAVAFSPTIEVAIGLRIFQGMGSAALPVMGSTIISRLIPHNERGAAMGVILSSVGFAASIGPFLGGIIVQFASWRVVFGLVGVVLLALPLAWRMLPDSLDEVEGGHFDLVGSILMGAGVALLMYGFNVVQDDGFGLLFSATAGGGVLLLVIFALWIRRVDEPFAPPSMFANVRYVTTCVQAFAAHSTRFGTIVLVPIFLKEVNELAPIWVGVVLFPGALAVAFLSRRAGSWADARGPRQPVAFGIIVLLAGNLLTAYHAGGSPLGVTIGMTLVGLGFAFIQTPLLSTASQVLPHEQTSGGLGMFMMILFIGGATGVALAVTVVELQPVGVTSWVGLDVVSPRYSNAALSLSVLGLIGVALLRLLPNESLQE